MNDQATVVDGASVTVAVLANDNDPDNAPLTVVQVTSPAHGVAHITDNGTTVTYAPAANFQGMDTFTYTIADPAGVTATATVTVTVDSIAIAPPTLPDGQVQTKYSQQLTASGGTAPYTFAVTAGTLPQGLTLSSAGLLSGTPTAADTESLTITVTDTTGLSVPTPFTLTVDPAPTAPTVTSDPTDQVVVAGQTVTFQARFGAPSPTVQWQVSTDGGQTFADISGATGVSYSFIAQSQQDGTRYRAQFSNSLGQATTNAAVLTVQFAPIIVNEPDNLEVAAGGTASFTLAATSDPAVTGIRWQVSTNDGATFADIPGANSTTLAFTATAAQDGNEYQAILTNAIGSTTSQPATLRVAVVTVNSLPANSFQSFPVSWMDTNNPSGAGTETFNVSDSVNGGAWTPWLSNTTLTGAVFAGQLDQTYAFYAQAAASTNSPPPFAEAQTATPVWQQFLTAEPENTLAPSVSKVTNLLSLHYADPDEPRTPGPASPSRLRRARAIGSIPAMEPPGTTSVSFHNPGRCCCRPRIGCNSCQRKIGAARRSSSSSPGTAAREKPAAPRTLRPATAPRRSASVPARWP